LKILKKDKLKVIFDCDTGLDDAIAIATLVNIKELEIRGICTVAGNVEGHKTTRNTLDVLGYLQRDIKVYMGESKPLERELEVAYDFHGESGIGDIVLKKSNKEAEKTSAIEFMYREIMDNKGEIHLVATGPGTNVAKLLLEYPETKEHIGSITFMGGAIVGGNVSPHAEFNVFCDPEATKVIVESGCNVTMVGLDATMKAKLYREDMEFLKECNSIEAKLVEEFYEGMLNVRGNMGFDFAVFHDSIALITLVKEDLFIFKNYRLSVDLGEERLGKTYEVSEGKPVRVAMDFDKEGFKEYMKEIFAK
jgi:inosine-uridine nucleoside N-ribohydrolase